MKLKFKKQGYQSHAVEAVAFQQGRVKHVYFVAETKGSMSSMDLRKIEESKIECARKFFAKITDDQVKYGIVDGYSTLMGLVAQPN